MTTKMNAKHTAEPAPASCAPHTGGNWFPRINDNGVLIVDTDKPQLTKQGRSAAVCLVAPGDDMTEEDKANAELIAQAPRLLKACAQALETLKHVWPLIHDRPDFQPELKAAIAAAGPTSPSANGAALERWESLQQQVKAALFALHSVKMAAEDPSRPPSARLARITEIALPVLEAYAWDHDTGTPSQFPGA